MKTKLHSNVMTKVGSTHLFEDKQTNAKGKLELPDNNKAGQVAINNK